MVMSEGVVVMSVVVIPTNIDRSGQRWPKIVYQVGPSVDDTLGQACFWTLGASLFSKVGTIL